MPRTCIALALSLLSSAALAQTAPAPGNVVTPAPPPREGTVGPEQLRDFSLPGTPRPTPTPTPTPTPPVPQEAPPATPTGPAPTVPAARSGTAPTQTPEGSVSATAAPDVSGRDGAAPASPPSEDPSSAAPAPGLGPLSLPDLAEPPLTAPEVERSDIAQGGLAGWWPWLLVAALAGIGLAMFARRRRLASSGPDMDDGFERVAAPLPEPSPPAPSPPAVAPALPEGRVTTRLRSAPAPRTQPLRAAGERTPEPTPAPGPAGAVVSRRLRAWIDLDLRMREILLDGEQALCRFDLTVINGGAAPARSIAIEAVALNAGETQAEELARFFARTATVESGIEEIDPLGSATLSHDIRLPRSAIRAYEAQGRTLFVPILAFVASFRTAGAEGRTGAAFLIGRDVPGSDRLAPLVLATDAARLLGLGVRRLEDAVRR